MKDWMMARLSVSALRSDLALILRKVEHENYTYIVARHDRPVAAMIPMHSFRLLQEIEIAAIQEGVETASDPAPDAAEPIIAEAVKAGKPTGYLRRLLRRREARRARRAGRAEAEAREERAADRWLGGAAR